MKLLFFAVLVLCFANRATAVEFADPVRMRGGAEPVRVERPGYAAPCWADIDGDGKRIFSSDSSAAERFASSRIVATASSLLANG